VGKRSNYSDKEIDEPIDSREFLLHINGPRRFDPFGGSPDDEGPALSQLIEHCSGDWSWNPARDKALGENCKTFMGVPAGAAELYGRSSYSPA
jgi:hypothetical protein